MTTMKMPKKSHDNYENAKKSHDNYDSNENHKNHAPNTTIVNIQNIFLRQSRRRKISNETPKHKQSILFLLFKF